MHHSTRRVKRLRRPNFDRLSEDEVPPSSIYLRHRQGIQPDALRGAVLVAFVVVTIVLYILLWELERSSFTLVPNPNTNQRVSLSSTSTSTQQGDRVSPSGDDRSAEPSRMTPAAWPPAITRLPEEHDIYRPASKDDDRTINLEPSSFDTPYCNGTCRFLLPVRIGEQESKARIHFMQLQILARQLNRTIVLPNVGKSRISVCSQWHFGAYYDTNRFARRGDSSDSLTMGLEEFATWVDKRPVPPSALVISMGPIPRNHPNVDGLGSQFGPEDASFIVDKTEADPKILSCIKPRLTRLYSLLPETTLSIMFNSHSHKVATDASTRLVHLLSNGPNLDTDVDFDSMTGPGSDHTSHYSNASHPALANTDVLVLDYSLRHPLFVASAQLDFNLHYAPVLYDLAERLSDNLGSFLGVHWRMENVPVQNLAWCAASLVGTLRTLLQDDVAGKQIQHVWLATDYPRPLSTITDRLRFPQNAGSMSNGADEKLIHEYAPSERSSTFKALTSEHDDAIGMLAEAFQPGGDLDTWKLTDLAEQLRRYPYVEGRFELNENLLSDPGIFGIIDKLVVVQAKLFVSGSSDCSKTSSFSKQVIDARRDLFETRRGKGVIHNVVEYFGKW